MAHTAAQIRKAWKEFTCAKDKMTEVAFGPDRILVAPATADAWRALAVVILHHNYEIRTSDTDSYNCRKQKGSSRQSLHSFGIALDVNWHTNPYRKTPNKQKVRFSKAKTQAERGEDVRLARADTDMTPAIRCLPPGTTVYILERKGDWALVDLEGDTSADGFVCGDFLRPELPTPVPTPRPAVGGLPDVLNRLTPALVKKLFPGATPLSNITKHLPSVISALREFGLVDRPMALMALATIRAETAQFKPISEYKSRYNTRAQSFDLYDAGTRKGRNLGNTQRGDGPRFKGRGFIQLTGRDNYTRIGQMIGVDLVSNPDLANDSVVAGRILAAFLERAKTKIRKALQDGDLAKARKLINGGSHGLKNFKETFQKGERFV